MIRCINDYIFKKKYIKCMRLMHEIACYQTQTQINISLKSLAKVETKRSENIFVYTSSNKNNYLGFDSGACPKMFKELCDDERLYVHDNF